MRRRDLYRLHRRLSRVGPRKWVLSRVGPGPLRFTGRVHEGGRDISSDVPQVLAGKMLAAGRDGRPVFLRILRRGHAGRVLVDRPHRGAPREIGRRLVYVLVLLGSGHYEGLV